MKGFCQHCGRELNGDEPRCPECGMPTDVQTPTYSPYYAPAPRKKGNSAAIAIIIIAVIAACCIIGIAILPTLLSTHPTYEITVSVESASIQLDDLTQWNGSSTVGKVYLEFYYADYDGTHVKEVPLNDNYHVNSGEVLTSPQTFTIKVRGEPSEINYSAYLMYGVKYPGSHPGQYEYVSDYIDIYSVDTTKVTGGSRYYGTSGVSFSAEDYTENVPVTFTGDSDPIGQVTFRITSVKL